MTIQARRDGRQTALDARALPDPFLACAVPATLVIGSAMIAGLLRRGRGKGPAGPEPTPQPTPAELAAEGRFEEAGRGAERLGQLGIAAELFERAGSLVKAAELYQALGERSRAARLYERAGTFRLAFAGYEASGQLADAARVAAQSGQADLLARAAEALDLVGDRSVAAELFRRAGKLGEAERLYRAIPGQGLERALEMYLEALEASAAAGGAASRRTWLAEAAASILDEIGRVEDAAALRAGGGSPGSSPMPAAVPRGRSSSGSGPMTAGGLDAPPPIDAPVTSVDAFAPRALVGEGEPATAVDPAGPASAGSAEPPGMESLEQEVRDRYDILGVLGRGGMGEVYKARDRTLGRIVALKTLSPALAGQPSALALFQREARAAAALSHPAIVTIYDLGVLGGRPFISMAFVDGADLGSVLRAKGRLPFGTAARIAAQVADALDYAHEQGVVHRDIKPANLLVSRQGLVTVVDFGVAKAVAGGGGAASMIAGTPEYMAPEQLDKGVVDGRADLFSLGVVLYRLLTGARPFVGASRTSSVAPPSALVAEVPPTLDEVTARALALAPGDRFPRGRRMAAALRRAVAGREA